MSLQVHRRMLQIMADAVVVIAMADRHNLLKLTERIDHGPDKEIYSSPNNSLSNTLAYQRTNYNVHLHVICVMLTSFAN